MQKMKNPATMEGLFGQRYQERAGRVVFNQRIRQQDFDRVQNQSLTPERGIVVVLAENRTGKIDAAPIANDSRLRFYSGGRRLQMRTEMAIGSVEERPDDWS